MKHNRIAAAALAFAVMLAANITANAAEIMKSLRQAAAIKSAIFWMALSAR